MRPERAEHLSQQGVQHKSHIYGIHVRWVDNRRLHPKQTLKMGQEEMGESRLEDHPQTADK